MATDRPPNESTESKAERLLEVAAAALFLTQIVHLIWMSTYVIPIQLGESPLWSPPATPLALADYLEIPAIVTTSILYIRNRRWLLLLLVNLQLLHIYWITDEIILSRDTLHPLLAWTAILIDYLELPVIYDTVSRVARQGLPGFREADPAGRSRT